VTFYGVYNAVLDIAINLNIFSFC